MEGFHCSGLLTTISRSMISFVGVLCRIYCGYNILWRIPLTLAWQFEASAAVCASISFQYSEMLIFLSDMIFIRSQWKCRWWVGECCSLECVTTGSSCMLHVVMFDLVAEHMFRFWMIDDGWSLFVCPFPFSACYALLVTVVSCDLVWFGSLDLDCCFFLSILSTNIALWLSKWLVLRSKQGMAQCIWCHSHCRSLMMKMLGWARPGCRFTNQPPIRLFFLVP